MSDDSLAAVPTDTSSDGPDGPRGDVSVLVVTEAPVPGATKPYLTEALGADAAAALASAALRDTITAAAQYAGAGRCVLAVVGDLDAAVDAEGLREDLQGWTVVQQDEDSLAQRLAAAHGEVEGPVVQIGTDTPQVTAELLAEVAAGLHDHDAVLAPAVDGDWWALALREPDVAEALRYVEMSTPSASTSTHNALEAAGLKVASARILIDVDDPVDAEAVARAEPSSRFAACWRALQERDVAPDPAEAPAPEPDGEQEATAPA